MLYKWIINGNIGFSWNQILKQLYLFGLKNNYFICFILNVHSITEMVSSSLFCLNQSSLHSQPFSSSFLCPFFVFSTLLLSLSLSSQLPHRQNFLEKTQSLSFTSDQKIHFQLPLLILLYFLFICREIRCH